jgi:hypothetical protein
MPRIKHQLWKVSNGWLLVPEGANTGISATDAPQCAVFKTLKEFSEQYPKRERRKATTKTKASEPQHTLD